MQNHHALFAQTSESTNLFANPWLYLIILIVAGAAAGITYFILLRKAKIPDSTAGNDGEVRSKIAQYIATFCVVGVIALAFAVILTPDKEGAEKAKFVFGAVLPLLGTWLGTILAYYFARENLAAATQSVSTFAKQMAHTEDDSDVPIDKRMRPLAEIRTHPLTPGAEDTVPLSSLPKDERIPVIGKDGRDGIVIYLLYRSLLDAYLNAGTFPNNRNKETVTLADYLSDPIRKEAAIKQWATIKPTATIGDARREMARLGEKCQDVFITETGNRDGKLKGWLTNHRLNREA